ncbi:uncharacterized protein ZSWIM9 [Microcaecilia unicolor]|uniref:Uncharacterized protein ZSWIM9-like n=1 Tax=Microcaecilia unicolor TaxID=1415580 RepID=A0A6P7XDF1_9AMPH|nr:uncharacterized protein ZSWIM9-like [Microcaecilia unicolor]
MWSSTVMDEKELHGKEFCSWEEFSLFFDSWCEQRKVLFFVKNSLPLSKCKWACDPPRPEVVDALKYSSVRLVCKDRKGAASKMEPGDPKMQNQDMEKKGTVGCTATIVLKMNHEKDRLVVTDSQLTHSHPLCPIEFSYYFRKGFLMANSCLPVRTTNKISKQFVGAQEIQRLLSYCKTRDNGVQDTLKALDSLFTDDPGAKVKLVFVENKVVIQTVFFLTSMMRSFCQCFPLVLFFDHMVSFNEEFDLYTVLCMDAFGQGRDCAYCVTQKGTPNVLRFTLASLLQSVPDMKFKVRCVTLGVEIKELEVVKELLPHARVHIFRTQVLEILFTKAQEMGAPEDEKVWPLLCELAESSSLTAYSEALRKMDVILPENFMKYYREHWHPCCEMWVEYGSFEKVRDIDASELINQHKQKLLAGLNLCSTVAQCILDLVTIQTSKEEVKTLNEEEVATRYHSICNPESASLIKEELSFATYRAYNIRETRESFVLYDGVSEFSMDLSLTSCSCSIHTSSLLPCRHLFATRLRNGEPLFDMSLLQKNKTAV